jgi:putative RecB family exonuclease
MYTGMPNGRAMTIPEPVSRRRGDRSGVAGGCSGVMLATHLMLRAPEVVRVGARPAARRPGHDGEIPPNVGGLPYGGAVDKSVAATVPAQATEVTAAEAQGAPRGPALSPSRAADFMTCPLLYRFRVIDKLPEPPTIATARGTLVHAALERLFDLPAAERTPEAARELVLPEWDRLTAAEPELAALFGDDAERDSWLTSAVSIMDAYFTLEDPRRLEPAEREAYVETTLESGLRLRGYIDRLDVAPSGDIRIVDYKTGRAPREAYEASALFQMKFYALVIWRLRGQVPRLLQLMYLAEGEVLRYSPDESDLLATERKVAALWKAIERARDSGDWRPRPSKLCDWCNHKALCPEFGGTPPPLPEPSVASVPQPDPGPAEALPEPSLAAALLPEA